MMILVQSVHLNLFVRAMQVPNRFHHSDKEAKRKLKPQAMRQRKAALKALKRKLTQTK